jgi:hypothetical protein
MSLYYFRCNQRDRGMNTDRFSTTERIGVNYVERVFLKDFGWIPRLIFQSDLGIDMEVEICKDGKPTGQLIGVQKKLMSILMKK